MPRRNVLPNSRFSSRILNFNKNNPSQKINTNLPKILVNNKILIIFNKKHLQSYLFFKKILDNQVITSNSKIIYTNNDNDVINIIKSYYNLGFRLFIGTDNTSQMLTLVDYFNNTTDAIYINTVSTVPLNNLPKNIIRTSINDNELLSIYLGNFLPNINTYTTTKNSVLSSKLIVEKNVEFVFTNIVYIYTDGIYENTFLENLILTNNELKFYNISSFKIKDKFPDELISLLKANPVNSDTYYSSKKTLFIVNSVNTSEMLNLFHDEDYYNNFFAFTDTFDIYSMESQFYFNYIINPLSSSSLLSKKISEYFGYSINSQILSIIDILNFIQMFYDYIFNKSNKLDIILFNLSLFFLNKRVLFHDMIETYLTNFHF
jgi:phospholipid N-methyltransferase